MAGTVNNRVGFFVFAEHEDGNDGD